MRSEASAPKVRAFLQRFGREVRGEGAVFLTGGATALLLGWRDATIDVDLSMDPEPPGAFEVIARLKEGLDLNVELVSPADFLPALPGWRERSRFIERVGPVDFFHYDLCAQALSKLERAHVRDLEDVRQMVVRGLLEPGELLRHLEAIEPRLVRYPAVDPKALRRKVEAFVAACGSGP